MSVLDLYNNTRELANNTINNLAQTQAITPKRNLQEAYNIAMGKTTPNWAINLSNAMPSIGEIVANATIKNGFQQRPVAESLERQKNRQQAYNQWLKENEQNQVNDYVQMAKEQLGMDIAEDEREYNRNMAQLNRDDRLNAQKQAYNQWLQEQEEKKRQQEIANKWKEIEDINKREAAEQAKIQQEFENNLKTQNAEVDRAYKQAQTDEINYKISPEYRNQVLRQEEDKAKEEENKRIRQEIKSLNDKGSIDSATYIAIDNDTSLRKYLKPKSNAFGGVKILGTNVYNSRPNTYEIDFEQILKDNGIEKPTKAQIKVLKKQMGL